ncbi:hypothetical protein ACT3CD_16500 [Geofilum sp. OHC36d9]|uniref:hypothetical protein n=1 Tax=Geofilum sp. OHC36d9 TaxID=3458413 RepID=UPI00403392B4
MRIYQVLVFILILASCSKDDDVVIKKEIFFPLSVGNEWKYDIFNVNAEQNLSEHTFSVAKDTSISKDNKEYNFFVVESYRSSNQENNWNIFWGHDDDGNLLQYGARVNATSIFDMSIQYKKNVNVGDIWNYNHLIYNEEDGLRAEANEIECVQLDTIIETSAGEFTCIKYYDKFKRYEEDDEKRFFYVDPKVGLIKFTLIYNGEIESEMSLKEYSIE